MSSTAAKRRQPSLSIPIAMPFGGLFPEHKAT